MTARFVPSARPGRWCLGLIALWTAAVVACGSEAVPPPPASAPPPPVVAPPPPPSPPPPPPSPADLASTALEEGRYEDVCAYLVTQGFSADICAWIAATAREPGSGSFSSRTFESFLRAQHVRRVSGSIVGFYDERNNEYEVRVGGRIAILEANETAFETTGRFTMWAQGHGVSEEVLASGREVAVPIYREWPLYQAIRDVVAADGAAARAGARMLFDELLRGWFQDYCWVDDPNGIGDCWVAASPTEAGAH